MDMLLNCTPLEPRAAPPQNMNKATMATTCKKSSSLLQPVYTAAPKSYYLQAIYYHHSFLYIMLELTEVDKLVNEQRCELDVRGKVR